MKELNDSGLHILRATLPTGNQAVYLVSPMHVNLQHFHEVSLNQVCQEYGKMIAVKVAGDWYNMVANQQRWGPKITDQAVIDSLEAVEHA